MDREFDIIVWGATGYTGRRIVRSLVESYVADEGLKIAVAGRSAAKLHEVCAEAGAPETPIIIATSDDQAAVDAVAKRAKAVISAVGPYALYGTSMVAACAAAGTDYVDITGEKAWVHDMIEQHSDAAKASGARIVHTCGFDCIPFDYGVMVTQKFARETFGAPAREVMGRIKSMRVAPSGGSLATAVELITRMSKDKTLSLLLDDPYALAKDPKVQRPEQPDSSTPRFDPETGKWAAEFVLSSTNMAIVHRTNMMLGYAYGQDFEYSEMFTIGDEKTAKRKARFQNLRMVALSFAPVRSLVKTLFLPKQGDGGTEEELEKGRFAIDFFAKGPAGKTIRIKMVSEQDPGYVVTPLLVIESAISLMKETTREITPGGIYSPAAAMKEPFIERLERILSITTEHLG